MRHLFAPGCALVLYKKALAERAHACLREAYGDVELLLTCCRHTPRAAVGNHVINVCPGCDRRYRENYASPSTTSLWEVLAGSAEFPFPDYGGRRMTIIDACPTKNQPRIHDAVRTLAKRMHIEVVEPELTREHSTCCGDIYHGVLSPEEVLERMKAKAGSLPVEEVLVYCVSCSKAMFIGGKRPRYLVDLLFGEDTVSGMDDPGRWHGLLDEFIAAHDDRTKETGG